MIYNLFVFSTTRILNSSCTLQIKINSNSIICDVKLFNWGKRNVSLKQYIKDKRQQFLKFVRS